MVSVTFLTKALTRVSAGVGPLGVINHDEVEAFGKGLYGIIPRGFRHASALVMTKYMLIIIIKRKSIYT